MTRYYAWVDDNSVHPLGECEDFSEADDKAPMGTHWIFDRDDLVILKEAIETVLAREEGQ